MTVVYHMPHSSHSSDGLKKFYKATIGFWLVQDKSDSAVCPSIIADKRINTMDHLPITNIWNGKIVSTKDFSEEAIITLIPEILTISGLEKDIYDYENISDIEMIRDKIETLTIKYIKP